MLRASINDIKRFFGYIDKLPNGCWYWTGARSRGKGNRKWYGSFRLGKQTVRAHRFSSEVLKGEECPPGHHRDHTCHFSMCVNPEHIEVVPKEINQERKVRRQVHARSEHNRLLARYEDLGCGGPRHYSGPACPEDRDRSGRLEPRDDHVHRC